MMMMMMMMMSTTTTRDENGWMLSLQVQVHVLVQTTTILCG